MPDEPEVHGLLSLMLINDARRDARFADDTVILLRDRGSLALESRSDRGGTSGARSRSGARCRDRYVLGAAIAALHVDELQDWRCPLLYGGFARVTACRSSSLFRAAALAEAGDAQAALELTYGLEPRATTICTRRELSLRRLDRMDDARAAYDRALELVHSDPERRFSSGGEEPGK